MKLPIVVTFDRKTATYGNPMTFRHTGEAIREFESLLKAPDKNKFNQNPEDFSLFQIATYEDNTGAFEAITPYAQIADGIKQ